MTGTMCRRWGGFGDSEGSEEGGNDRTGDRKSDEKDNAVLGIHFGRLLMEI